MGAVPHLPVPPPYKMRAEDGALGAVKSGESTPADGNSLPLYLLHMPVPMYVDQDKTLAVTTNGALGSALPPSTTATDSATGAPLTVVPSDASNAAELISGSSPAAPTKPDAERPTLEQILRQFNSASGDGSRADSARADAAAARAANAALAQSSNTTVASANALPAGLEAAMAAAKAGNASRDVGRSTHANAPQAVLDARADAGVAVVRSADFTLPTLEADARRGDLLDGSARGLLKEVAFEAKRSSEGSQPFVLAAQTTQTASATPVRADGPVLQLNTPVAQPEWADGIGERVVWLTQNDLNNAQIRLNPAHLGPIDVQVNVTDDRASVSLVAQHATTREALESAAPRLREMLSAQGFTNVNVDISNQSTGHSAGHRSAANPEQRSSWAPAQAHEDVSAQPSLTSAPRTSRTALDTFA